MTTTAFDDQFVSATETILALNVRDECQQVHDLQVRLAAAIQRATDAEAEMAKLREQAPAGWVDADGDFYHGRNYPNVFPTAVPVYAAPVPAPAVPYGIDEEAANRIALAVYDCKNGIKAEPLLHAINHILMKEIHPLSQEGLAQMQPIHQPVGNPDTLTPHKGATHCDDCGLTWLDDGLNPLRCPYCVPNHNARRYLALRENEITILAAAVNGFDADTYRAEYDAAADRLLESGE